MKQGGRRAARAAVVYILPLALALALHACGGARTGAAGPRPERRGSDVEVTLEVFSGRPNPTWTLSPDEQSELARRLEGLPPSERAALVDDLGYRGFRIAGQSGVPGVPSDIRVVGGVVIVEGDRSYVDANGIEEWLRAKARERGFGALVDG